MVVDSLLLAELASARDGLLYVIAGGIDTFPSSPLPPGTAGAVPGQVGTPVTFAAAMRLLLTRAELGRQHPLEFLVMDEDGRPVIDAKTNIFAPPNPNLPPGWEQPAAMTFNLSIVPTRFGYYRLDVMSNGATLKGVPFRIVMAVQAPPVAPTA